MRATIYLYNTPLPNYLFPIVFVYFQFSLHDTEANTPLIIKTKINN